MHPCRPWTPKLPKNLTTTCHRARDFSSQKFNLADHKTTLDTLCLAFKVGTVEQPDCTTLSTTLPKRKTSPVSESHRAYTEEAGVHVQESPGCKDAFAGAPQHNANIIQLVMAIASIESGVVREAENHRTDVEQDTKQAFV
ncbi:hypothetical protein EJ05DRAFT_502315 [Pseudovirgaria hyperparasitica]|uniref:Uncharacterized protein n=1 Tax=Pseudovirgaria hyperparasitica TaxID=470096 RepID=A0A6A6W128_9PEZI|nr:uncharacterized protein EJ05DRAFT_502315 [Pseudovirgaria hyperparasitica]KAF2755839.1 hypothetical protein EJ05DRAFT_502315 [Pseudovirgaria hyperparasitica]